MRGIYSLLEDEQKQAIEKAGTRTDHVLQPNRLR